ncbi:hypothetical protein vBRpoPV13_49 [Ruegeria phage vB_RpoP-V13]|jgi:hypothetical protein|uniref:AAA+ ATPase domain-containing protein n=1 Tax=Ruegeria phage vB_RpoP-V13 TaxID=2218612 RepID=A0A2Z4QI22_9CAUD|nr:Sak4-like ssDNA annealing protein [Ruegeria phage vB_RpoP-V13]AWY09406.1 hypothetical protein vBRpoPV13_49 [Ruegeria phage vB_RpoP-V13]
MGTEINPHSLLICGESGAGKSMSLYEMRDRTDVLYINCEGGKPLPFKNKFKNRVVTDPEDIIDWLEQLEEMGEDNPFNFVVIDTISFMMDMFETIHVLPARDTQKMWGQYAQFFKRLITQSSKVDSFFIYLGHLDRQLDEDNGIWRSSVPVKGALAKKGLEAYFTTVINVSKEPIRELQKTPNSMLHITEDDEELGFKHVFQTRTTKKTIGDRIRSPMGMWAKEELFIDNNLAPVIKKMIAYYED